MTTDIDKDAVACDVARVFDAPPAHGLRDISDPLAAEVASPA